jgi:hypothetical protein
MLNKAIVIFVMILESNKYPAFYKPNMLRNHAIVASRKLNKAKNDIKLLTMAPTAATIEVAPTEITSKTFVASLKKTNFI